MQIYYCHSCNKLISPGLIESGEVKIKEQEPPICPDCVPARTSRSGKNKAAASGARAGRKTPAATPARRVRNTPVPTRGTPGKGTRSSPPSANKIEPARPRPAKTAESGRPRPAKAAEPTRTRQPAARTGQQGAPVAIIGAAIGGVLLIVILIAAASGSSNNPPPVKKKITVEEPTKTKVEDDTGPVYRGPGFVSPPPKKQEDKPKTVTGRYVRIQLPGNKRTLSLAEVEVMSGEDNVGPKGKATQSSTHNGGNAGRAIDGRKGGYFKNNSVTHTKEQKDPWWEVDLGRDYEIRKVVVHNRTDKGMAGRLKGFTLKVLDSNRKEVWKREKVPAPNPYYVLFPK